MTKTGRGSRLWTGTMTNGSKSGEGTSDLPFALRFMIGTWRAVVLVPACTVLLLWCCLDFLPRRGLKQSTSPPQNRRKLPVPIREGSDIFVLNPDGSKVALDALEAKVQAEAWNSVISGAFVYEKTRVRLDESA